MNREVDLPLSYEKEISRYLTYQPVVFGTTCIFVGTPLYICLLGTYTDTKLF